MVGNQILISLFLLLFFALVGLTIAKKISVPALVGYLAMGMLLKYFADLMLVGFDVGIVDQFAKIGVTLLLFLLGIEFEVKNLTRFGGVGWWGSLIQMVGCFVIGIILLLYLGLGFVPSMVFAGSLSISSTALGVKLLVDRRKLDSVEGKILTSWLLVQDVAVIPILLTMSLLSGNNSVRLFGLTAVFVAIVIFKKYGRILFDYFARVGGMEALVMLSVVVGLGYGLLFEYCGLSMALGGFVAGVLLSETSERYEIFARLSPVRDLFAGIFFLSIGFLVSFRVMAINFALIMAVVLLFGLLKFFFGIILTLFQRVYYKASLGVALGLFGAGEFAFVIGALAWSENLIDYEGMSVLVAVVVLSMLLASILGMTEYRVQIILKGVLLRLGGKNWLEGPSRHEKLYMINGHIIILGHGRMGGFLVKKLLEQFDSDKLVVVDNSIDEVETLSKNNISSVYGDCVEGDILNAAGIERARMLVITVPGVDLAKRAVMLAKSVNPNIYIVARAHSSDDKKQLIQSGVDRVVLVEESAGRLLYGHIKIKYGSRNRGVV